MENLNTIEQLKKETGLSKEEIKQKAVEMFKTREPIILERMEQLEEDIKNGKNPFLDIDKILEDRLKAEAKATNEI